MSDGGVPRHGIKRRKKKLTDEQIAALIEWKEKVEALGSRKQALQRAHLEWKAARRALGSRKQILHELGIHVSTFNNYLGEWRRRVREPANL